MACRSALEIEPPWDAILITSLVLFQMTSTGRVLRDDNRRLLYGGHPAGDPSNLH